jgi:gamma-glutamyltranspeptidase / glutathione hydrolase
VPRRLIFLALSTVCTIGFTIHGQGEQPPGVPSADGLVVCVSAPACDAGASVLARGGNAVDAAVATGFALAVTHPSAGNIGGGGFMVIRLPNGRTTAFDFREKAPRRSTPTMYLDAEGNIDRSLTAAGYLAPGVPGTVRGFAAAHKKFGKLPWRDVVMPGVTLAEQGFPLSASLARSLTGELKRMAQFPASVAAYGKPGGGEWIPGDRLVLTDLGRTLRAIATDGPDAFYKGWIADRIAADMKANGGLITKSDLDAYRAKERTPVKGTYRGFDIISMPPPSSGGVALIEMLNILEPLNLKSLGLLTPTALHAQIEAMRRAYLDRARYLGDPDFSRIPVSRLIAKAHAREVSSSIDSTHASRSGDLGQDLLNRSATEEPDETTHYSVIDRQGLAVATTYTLEGGFGSHVVVNGAGFLLNNEMGDFNKKPGMTNDSGDIGTPANTIAPGKRMLSSMTPTIVAKDRKLVLVTGSPGGRTIINTVLAIVLGVTEYGLNGREAVNLARLHHQWMPDRVSVEEQQVPAETLERLRAMGHEVRTGVRQGDAHSIWIGPDGQAYGVNDTRTAGSKASVPALGEPSPKVSAASRRDLTAPSAGR